MNVPYYNCFRDRWPCRRALQHVYEMIPVRCLTEQLVRSHTLASKGVGETKAQPSRRIN